jgi:hypothetical protein
MRKIIQLFTGVVFLVPSLGFTQTMPMGPFGVPPQQIQGSPFPGGAVGMPPRFVGEQSAMMMNPAANAAGAAGAGCTVDRNGASRVLADGTLAAPGSAGHQ